MSFLSLAELFGIYCVVAFIIAAACLAAWINLFGDVPLLDGTRLRSVLDDRDRARMVAAHDRDEEHVCNAFALELEEIRNLPERDPWKRWLP
jgi:hypothetical protein